MPKFQYIGEPFSRENPGTICEFMEADAIEMRKPSNVYWLELPDNYVPPKIDVIKEKIKKHDAAIADGTLVTGLENPIFTPQEKPKPLPAFTKEQAVKRTLSPEHLAKLKAGRDSKRAE